MRLLVAALVGVVLLAAGCGSSPGLPSGSTSSAQSTGTHWPSSPGLVATGASTLVLYDAGDQYSELYTMEVANLVSHFGGWTAHPVGGYARGEGARYTAVVYIGWVAGARLPAAFLDDVLAARVPVMWLGDNLDQLMARKAGVASRLGFTLGDLDRSPVAEVRYKGTSLARDAAHNTSGVRRVEVTAGSKVATLAEAVRGDGGTLPWAVRSGALTYLAELPFAYMTPDDRYLAFTDLLFDLLAPSTPVRHRALVRIEDVGPQSDPAQLRAIADYLSGAHVPFAVAVFAEYDDAAGVYNGGRPVHRRLRDAPEVVAALEYMAAHGGTLIAHGYTHGYAGGPNPYGVSAEDFEFWRSHVDAANQVVLDGPVPEDSPSWAADRLTAARAEWAAVGLPTPDIFEFPHYLASADDYRAISGLVAARYERANYFAGVLTGGRVDPAVYASQFFPYPVRDVYGAAVIPETLGNVATQMYNQNEPRSPAQILDSARRQLVVRDGVASFFYHPFLGLQYLPQLVAGIRSLGYTFVPARELIPAR
ncbi:DUF2334 domain-containing protein [Planosporangium thailandense]|uniref:DUF2334 domain-containing protein n=2 Tax=Planosporangium thailandense TaxID=765197 RepID=A0ABX0Y3U8_9ACTN|nr:DUF2334 domain-containing protein [Planosporangium thailandense]